MEIVHLRKPLNLFWFLFECISQLPIILSKQPINWEINEGSDFRYILMLHNILQIKMTKPSKVIKILTIYSFPVEGFYIILNIFPKSLSVPTELSHSSGIFLGGKIICL